MLLYAAAFAVPCMLGTQVAGAQEAASDWRKTYDLILMWINFGIFIFLLLRFVRQPLKKFIVDKRNDLERKISRLEEEKAEADRKVQDILRAVDESQAEFEALKQKIIEQGKLKKQEIVQEAREKSRVMLEDAQLRVENQIARARKKLRDDLVDAAVELAMERLPRHVTAEDNQKLIRHYLAGAKRNAVSA